MNNPLRVINCSLIKESRDWMFWSNRCNNVHTCQAVSDHRLKYVRFVQSALILRSRKRGCDEERGGAVAECTTKVNKSEGSQPQMRCDMNLKLTLEYPAAPSGIHGRF